MDITNVSWYKILHSGANPQKYQTLALTRLATLRYSGHGNDIATSCPTTPSAPRDPCLPRMPFGPGSPDGPSEPGSPTTPYVGRRQTPIIKLNNNERTSKKVQNYFGFAKLGIFVYATHHVSTKTLQSWITRWTDKSLRE